MFMKFWKAMLVALALACFSPHGASAQDVVVDGVGIDRQSALRDAERNAVESVVGTYIDSRTLVKDAMVELDEIYSKSDGYVTNVQVLQENGTAEGYRIRAQVTVDTTKTELVNRIQVIARLNDPRIAVVALREDRTHEDIIETAMVERLISMGFQHVVDANIVAGLQNAQLLDSLYNGRPISGVGSGYGVDFIVMGKCRVSTNKVSIPDFKGGYKDTRLSTGRSEMTAKIIRLDTGDILDTFSIEGRGTWNSGEQAEREAMKDIASQAAKKVEDKFRSIGARSSGSVQITAAIRDYSNIQKLTEDLRSIPGVQNVFVREQAGGKVIIDLDTNQTAKTVIDMLKSRTRLGIFVDSFSGNSAKIIVS